MTDHGAPVPDIVPASDHRPLPRVAFQGIPGAFSELAIHRHFVYGAVTVPGDTFALALRHLTTGVADFAVIPVENVIAGPVEAAVAALGALPHLRFHGDVRIDIQLCLMAMPGATLEHIRTVHSHQMALAQSGRFFSQHPWMIPEVHVDTAGAARDVARQNDLSMAAIASETAATRYQLDILARAVQDIPDNWTRFVIVSER